LMCQRVGYSVGDLVFCYFAGQRIGVSASGRQWVDMPHVSKLSSCLLTCAQQILQLAIHTTEINKMAEKMPNW